ncbi:hypothetical protein HUG15_09120 [Salicibibacter cibarius]|uniref:Uncharacterized protein n=1 Tax=Salicibibacter cibarius TaxID=2743000 RepID=A0A7T7CBD7_9BACI|nr:hypothetical protein [Salicibibacter cibarius]QQK75709.1 hypothetical protein HUG15_09120 [Salicibibacter cibarius]
MSQDMNLQQIAESIPKSLLNASDKDVEALQGIIDQTLEVRDAHKELQRMVKDYTSTKSTVAR